MHKSSEKIEENREAEKKKNKQSQKTNPKIYQRFFCEKSVAGTIPFFLILLRQAGNLFSMIRSLAFMFF